MSKIKITDMMGIMRIVNDNKTKDEQCHLLHFEHKKVQWLDGLEVGWGFEIFRERESTFSLDFRPIGPSVLN